MASSPKISLLLTGNELMSGDTVDRNSAIIAQALAEKNLQVTEKATVGDDFNLLCRTLSRLIKDYDVVIVNGGLGPTVDDLTTEVVASLIDDEIVENSDARHHVEAWCRARGITANQADLKQVYLPRGSEIVPNPVGSAVGFVQNLSQALVIATPGVTNELKAMLSDIVTRVTERVGCSEACLLRLQTFGIGEAAVQQIIREQIPDWPAEVKLGFRAGLPQLELKLAIEEKQQLGALEFCHQKLLAAFGDHIIGSDDDSLVNVLQSVLREQGKTVTTAESCTGGQIAAMITKEAGASAVFDVGFVTYSNAMKRDVLGVDHDDLRTYGAVSEPVVRQMLLGALECSGADIGVAVSGIAGPEGGTENKPVGSVWIAWGTESDLRTHQARLLGTRQTCQILTAAMGIDLMRRHLLGLPPLPNYFTRQMQ